MPAALVTLLVALAWPAAAVVPATLVALPLHFGAGLVRLFGSLTLGDVRIPAPLLGQSAAFCVLLAATIVLAHRALGARLSLIPGPGKPQASNSRIRREVAGYGSPPGPRCFWPRLPQSSRGPSTTPATRC